MHVSCLTVEKFTGTARSICLLIIMIIIFLVVVIDILSISKLLKTLSVMTNRIFYAARRHWYTKYGDNFHVANTMS